MTKTMDCRVYFAKKDHPGAKPCRITNIRVHQYVTYTSDMVISAISGSLPPAVHRVITKHMNNKFNHKDFSMLNHWARGMDYKIKTDKPIPRDHKNRITLSIDCYYRIVSPDAIRGLVR